MAGNQQYKSTFAWVSLDTDGTSVSPAYTFESEASLGFYRSAASQIAVPSTATFVSRFSALGSPAFAGASFAGASTYSNTVTIAASGYTGTALQAFSATSCAWPAGSVKPSASSFTIFVWPAVRQGDAIMVNVGTGVGISSLSSGLILHSHCTVNGQCELRISNVSTLEQIQSAQTLYFYRWSAF